ncbi:hypothetical protein N6L27_21110 [Leisingera sp. SS27]|uniref:hypothetical protein n=1 Tax=Leisingera sp. SS27 TaxID=2979462 RepID=UPI00232E3CF8|nr:hypothetical protein [Leisingera sp. SS27]MDC0660515.1 hypothetical protein [Leisingera sp. SS27]
MATQYKTIFLGSGGGENVASADIAKMAMAIGKYLKDKGMQAQGIKLPGLKKAQALVAKCAKVQQVAQNSSQVKDLGFTPELSVVGGIDTSGHLSICITGMLPPPKEGKPPVNFDKTEVIRKDWNKLEAELADETNVVVNLTKKNISIIEEALDKLVAKHDGDLKKVRKDKVYGVLLEKFKGGDKVINRAAEKQAAKYKTKTVNTDEADFGELTTGTVALCAHGSREKINGIWLGTKLGKKSPDQIVDLLTGNKDKKKNLSKSFKGTVLLSGCFTAAGGIAPPGDKYDYDTYAGKVWRLLKAKGINCKVVGQPGTASTNEDGSKNSVMPTKQDEKDAYKAEIKALEKELQKLEKKLKSGDKATKKSATKKAQTLYSKIKDARNKSALTWMKDLQVNYGLDPLR